MKAHGNGRPETCALNLLRIIRGEVPYDRVRGIDASLIDKPNAAEDALADAEWLLETYEPRIRIKNAEANLETALTGDFYSHVELERKEDES